MAFLQSPCSGCEAFTYVQVGILAGLYSGCLQNIKRLSRADQIEKDTTFFFHAKIEKGVYPLGRHQVKSYRFISGFALSWNAKKTYCGPFFHSARLCTKTNWIFVNGTKYVPGTALNLIVSLCAGGSGTLPHANQQGWNLNRWST